MDPPCVLIPSYDDWESLAWLLPALDRALEAAGREADVLLVDDGSPTPSDVLAAALAATPPRVLRRVEVLRLVRNLGHQRAIAVGLSVRAAACSEEPTVVMDGDGEDRPEHVPVLLDAVEGAGRPRLVFAQRRKRTEGRSFRAFYRGYRLLQRALTGVTIDVGNFSAIPASLLHALAVTPDLWNHYPAAALSTRAPLVRVPLDRGQRQVGRSRLGLGGLVLHGLGAMSVFADRIGLRLLAASGALAVGTLALMGAVVAVRFGTNWAVPGWATYTVGLLAVILVLSLGLAASFTFTILNGRNQMRFIPLRDYALFVGPRVVLYERGPLPPPAPSPHAVDHAALGRPV